MKDMKKIIPLILLCLLAIKGLASGFDSNLAIALVALSGLIAFQDKNLEDASRKELIEKLQRSDTDIAARLTKIELQEQEIKDIKSYILAIKAGNQFNTLMKQAPAPVASKEPVRF